MTAIDRYRDQLRSLPEWREFLCANSRLPGPRANLELMYAAAREGTRERFLELIEAGEANECGSGASEFLVVCGLVGVGHLLASGNDDLALLRSCANDSRWRVREAVAMGLQEYGDADPAGLLAALESWIDGSPLEQRAVVAAACEPRLLKGDFTPRAVTLVDHATRGLVSVTRDSRAPGWEVLRQALGYGWSVLIAAAPEAGLVAFEPWLAAAGDPDIRWIVRENLGKKRLQKAAPEWVRQAAARLSPGK